MTTRNAWNELNSTVQQKLLLQLIPQHSPQQFIRRRSRKLRHHLHQAHLLNPKRKTKKLSNHKIDARIHHLLAASSSLTNRTLNKGLRLV